MKFTVNGVVKDWIVKKIGVIGPRHCWYAYGCSIG